MASHASAVSFTFTDISTQLIDSRLTADGRLLELERFDITNNTGEVWTDFHLSLEGQTLFGDSLFVIFEDIGAAGLYSGPGVASFSDSHGTGFFDMLTIDGLDIAIGGVLSFNVDIIAITESIVSFQIYGLPSIGQSGGPTGAIPEPSAGMLFLVGAACLGSGTRRKTRTS